MLVLLAACSGALIDQADGSGPWMRILGPIDEQSAVDGVDTRAAVAWVWSVDRSLCAAGEEVPFEPQVWTYAIEVPGPPDPSVDATCVPTPEQLDGAPSLAVGVPVLLEPTGGPVALRLDPSALFAWFEDGSGDLATAVRADGATVAAATTGFVLVAVGGTPAAGACGLEALQTGFTLYGRPTATCGPWVALAAPGARSEFQGVAMEALP